MLSLSFFLSNLVQAILSLSDSAPSLQAHVCTNVSNAVVTYEQDIANPCKIQDNRDSKWDSNLGFD